MCNVNSFRDKNQQNVREAKQRKKEGTFGTLGKQTSIFWAKRPNSERNKWVIVEILTLSKRNKYRTIRASQPAVLPSIDLTREISRRVDVLVPLSCRWFLGTKETKIREETGRINQTFEPREIKKERGKVRESGKGREKEKKEGGIHMDIYRDQAGV